jgi:hypothetical protein
MGCLGSVLDLPFCLRNRYSTLSTRDSTMSECLPNIPAGSTIRQNSDGSWQYQRRSVGPWLPIPWRLSGLPGRTDGPAVPESREPASVAAEVSPSPADRMALAMCVAVLPGSKPCQSPCNACRVNSAAVAHEIARQLRERHGGSSQVADWLDGVGCHTGTAQTVQEVFHG